MACENGGVSETACNPAKQPLSKDEIRKRVLDGNARRAHLKKGVAKRLLGNARAMIAGVFIASTALAGAAQEAMPFASRVRPDIVELSNGQPYVTQSFSRWGWCTVKPVELSSDLSDPRNREALSNWIENTCPRLVVLHGYCRNIQHEPNRSGVNRSQAQRRERKASERLSGLREFVHHVLERQMGRSDQFLIDLPGKNVETGDSLGPIICKHPNAHVVPGHQPQGGTCVWATNCVRIADELGKLTQSQHECNRRESADTLRRDIARAICRGYATYLRDVDPGRIRRMLRSVSARIRRKVHHGDSDIHELRWNEKNIARVLKQWSAVFAQGDAMDEDDGDEELIPDLEEPHGDQRDHHMEDQAGTSEAPHQHVKAKLASHGISFEVPVGRRLSEAIRQGLIKAHCNLGHPSKEDLARFLKLGGARQEVVEAVNWMRCVTCAHARRPSTHRTTNIPPCQLAFGDEVQLDCVCIRDANKENHRFLSVLDRATSFHVLELLRDHSPLELHRAFDRGWCKWAGPPMRVTTDLEGGFVVHEFWTQVTQAGSSLSSIAGTAHFQAGKIERHNQTIKDMMFATIRQTSPIGREDMRKLSREVAWAKNCLVREHGWAPVALVFGREPRVFGELYHEGKIYSSTQERRFLRLPKLNI